MIRWEAGESQCDILEESHVWESRGTKMTGFTKTAGRVPAEDFGMESRGKRYYAAKVLSKLRTKIPRACREGGGSRRQWEKQGEGDCRRGGWTNRDKQNKRRRRKGDVGNPKTVGENMKGNRRNGELHQSDSEEANRVRDGYAAVLHDCRCLAERNR